MKPGDPLSYRSIAGEIWPAAVVSEHREAGFVNLSIRCSAREGDVMELHRVTLLQGPTRTGGCAWPNNGTK